MDGSGHDARSEELFGFLKRLDFERMGDYFCWKSGGDGDNGEVLMSELDEWFKSKDEVEGKTTLNQPSIKKPSTNPQPDLSRLCNAGELYRVMGNAAEAVRSDRLMDLALGVEMGALEPVRDDVAESFYSAHGLSAENNSKVYDTRIVRTAIKAILSEEMAQAFDEAWEEWRRDHE